MRALALRRKLYVCILCAPPPKKNKKNSVFKKKTFRPPGQKHFECFFVFFLQTESYISLYIGCVYLAQYVLQKMLSNL